MKGPDRQPARGSDTPTGAAPVTGRSRHDEHAEKIRDSIGILRGNADIRFGGESDDAAHAASVALDALLDEVAAAEARAADAERERDSWERVARQYESALAERNLL